MGVLSRELRGKLEKAVERARDLAEEGARAALVALGVDAGEAPGYLSEADRELRNRLRAHAPQLGDVRDEKSGKHGIEHLVTECAYEHWHRMLFARFLAENGVLMHPDGVAVTLAECDELAEHEGLKNGWEIAERYAQRMLPQIFQPDAPVLQVGLPPEKQLALEKLLTGLPVEVFRSSDALGWVYQFWQAKNKARINASEVKIGADELPAVTQLFTEPYMVDFLLQNTLGAWWVDQHGRESLPMEMPYLRFLDGGVPAAGTFEGWPKKVAQLKVLDPCCGSGHFLVTALQILTRFRMVEEATDAGTACDAVLRDNLYGLEIDPRCAEIAAFALALMAWTYPGVGGYRGLPDLNVACSGLGIRTRKEHWIKIAGENHKLREGMGRLYELYQDAPTLGSLIDPNALAGDLIAARFEDLRPFLEQALAAEDRVANFEDRELGVTAQGILAAVRVLTQRFHLVATNVPYLVRGKQSSTLANFSELHYSSAKADLATTFLARCLKLAHRHGTVAIVIPQSWLFKTTYGTFRKDFLQRHRFDALVGLGPAAFQDMNWWAVKTLLAVMTCARALPDHTFLAIDLGEHRYPEEKPALLRETQSWRGQQSSQIANPDARILFGDVERGTLMGSFASCVQATALPAGRHGDEVGRRSELDVDGELILDPRESPQEPVALGNEPEIDVDSGRAPAEENGRRAARQVRSAFRIGLGAEDAHEAADPLGVG